MEAAETANSTIPGLLTNVTPGNFTVIIDTVEALVAGAAAGCSTTASFAWSCSP